MKIPNKRVQGMSHKVRHPLTRDVLCIWMLALLIVVRQHYMAHSLASRAFPKNWDMLGVIAVSVLPLSTAHRASSAAIRARLFLPFRHFSKRPISWIVKNDYAPVAFPIFRHTAQPSFHVLPPN